MRILNFLFLPFIFLTSVNNSFSQNYKQLEWDVLGVSSLISTSNNIGNAVGFYTEARFNFNNRISVGLNYKWQFFGELFDEPIRSAGITNSYGIAGDYYVFNDVNKRTFAGFAIGIFDNTATTESGIDIGGSGIGFIPRIGYELNFLRFTAKYNYTVKKDFPNYFEIGLGLNIGGRYI